ncbi:hypothetical protein EP1X_01270 [Thermococcus sp. EP1]|uniref:glycosyltransferase family 4 protein n=1 Tax=Thermococcus sp. EP1 TaxID=1591054 RepID=UPI0006DA97A2|nr:glycosyltransferase family 4 protein [Thermococcus sp. EP1]KPU63858.1 hypothetical protein EP1X_01270 [Thermococcus sp. EP1]
MKVIMIGPIETAGGVSIHTKELTRALKQLSIDVEMYNISSEKEYPTLVSNFIKLYRRTLGLSLKLIKNRKKSNIVHIQASGPVGGFLPAIFGAILKKLLGFHMIVTFHYSNTPLFVKKYKKLVSFVLRNSDMFIVVSNTQKMSIINAIKKYNDRIVVIPNGYNPLRLHKLPKSKARKELGLSPKDKIIVNVALLLEKKGHKYLIDAMSLIVNKYNQKNVRCFIIGKGPLKEELQKQIHELGLQDHVKLLGFVLDKELAYWMNAADLFVLPSLREGNPMVMFEALGVGLPFVGTAVGGIPEIITSEEYGLLCEPGNPKDLTEKILRALNKEWDREKIRKYAEQFTWEEIAKKTVEIYTHLLGG